MNNLKKANASLTASFLFLIAIIISIFLGLNNKYKILYNDSKIDYENKLALIQNTLILLAASIFLYLNYDNYKENKTNDNKLQTIASVLAVITAIIPVYLIIKNYNNIENEFEEPL